ncbi:MAG: hypothetical protein AB8B51_17240 [Sedimentitalea sp.]
MYKILAVLLLAVFGAPAAAQTCPEFYRFVDFGLEDRTGVLRRGGAIFRAFDRDGVHLLIPERAVCLSVEDASRDGHGNPIPVVASINVDPEIANLDLLDLRLMTTDGAAQVGDKNARPHREMLTKSDTLTARGDTYLCAHTAQSQMVSCQLVSPYDSNVALVVYCDGQQCQMPVLGRDDTLIASAVWRQNATDPDALGAEIFGKLRGIHGFVEGQF